MANHFNRIWNSKTLNSWITGHKPLFQYYARSNAPYAIKAKSDLNSTTLQRLYEYGGSRLALRFKFYAFPVGNCTSFRAFIRFWNPSWIWVGPLMPSGTTINTDKTNGAICYNRSHNDTASVRYHFDEELSIPSVFESVNYGSCDFPALANQGNGTSSGSPQYANVYDVWGSHLADTYSQLYFNYQKTAIYMGGYSSRTRTTDAYYADHEITGEALSELKRIIGSKGSVWLHVGTHVDNALSSNGTYADQGSTSTLYASRIELRIVCTIPRLNV